MAWKLQIVDQQDGWMPQQVGRQGGQTAGAGGPASSVSSVGASAWHRPGAFSQAQGCPKPRQSRSFLEVTETSVRITVPERGALRVDTIGLSAVGMEGASLSLLSTFVLGLLAMRTACVSTGEVALGTGVAQAWFVRLVRRECGGPDGIGVFYSALMSGSTDSPER